MGPTGSRTSAWLEVAAAVGTGGDGAGICLVYVDWKRHTVYEVN